MSIVATHTRLVAGAEVAYERLHREIPLALAHDLTAAGVADWTIWRSGNELFNVIDVADREAMREAMRRGDANREWQERVRSLLAPPPDPGDLPLVWSLRGQLR